MKINMNKITNSNKPFPKELEKFYTDKIKKNAYSIDVMHSNFEYKYDKNIKLLIPKLSESVKFTFDKSELPKEIKNIKDFERYLYNSQEVFRFNKNNNMLIEINGVKIDLNKYMLNTDGKESELDLYIQAEKFDENDFFQIEILKETFKLKRTKIKSVNEKLYEFNHENYKISFTISPEKCHFSFITNIANKTLVDELIHIFKMQLAFYEKEFLLNSKPISNLFNNFTKNEKNKVLEIKSTISFWEEIKKIESVLVSKNIIKNEKFKVSLPLTKEEVKLAEELIISISMNIGFKSKYKSSEFKFSNSLEELIEMHDKFKKYNSEMRFGGYTIETIELFYCKFDLFLLYRIENALIEESIIDEKNNELLLKIVKSSKDNCYILNKYFINETDIELEMTSEDTLRSSIYRKDFSNFLIDTEI